MEKAEPNSPLARFVPPPSDAFSAPVAVPTSPRKDDQGEHQEVRGDEGELERAPGEEPAQRTPPE